MKKEFLLPVAAVVLLLSLAIPVGAVTCDIKPGTWPNDINLDSHGVIPVAILGSADFDVSQIDPSTLEFECAKASKWNTSDVDGDGYVDLIAKFKTQQTCIVPGQTEATISWALYDGTEMSCSDSIHTVLAGSLPDLIVSKLEVVSFTATSITYSYTIKNVGTAPANLDGPTSADFDNVSVQAFLSQDTIFNNAGDIPAGGTILGTSPLGMLNPGDTFTGSFTSGVSQDPATFSYLTLMVDWGNVVAESDETNNTAAAPMP